MPKSAAFNMNFSYRLQTWYLTFCLSFFLNLVITRGNSTLVNLLWLMHFLEKDISKRELFQQLMRSHFYDIMT